MKRRHFFSLCTVAALASACGGTSDNAAVTDDAPDAGTDGDPSDSHAGDAEPESDSPEVGPECEMANCGVCDDDPDNNCLANCDGVGDGTAVLDVCGRCTGGGTDVEPCPTVTLEPVADAYVDSQAPGTNYGDSDLRVVRSSTAVYMRFDLSGLPIGAVVQGVKLQAHAFSGYAWGGDGRVYTQFVSDDTWTEDGITWTNRPDADSGRLGSWWLWYDDTPADKLGENWNPLLAKAVRREHEGDGQISLQLSSPGYDTTYHSRESATASQRPTLTVGYLIKP